MNNYYRITAYYPEDNFCFIMDSYGMFEKMWEFSSYLISKGMKIIEVSNIDTFLDYNIEKADYDTDHVILRANCDGKPEETTKESKMFTNFKFSSRVAGLAPFNPRTILSLK